MHEADLRNSLNNVLIFNHEVKMQRFGQHRVLRAERNHGRLAHATHRLSQTRRLERRAPSSNAAITFAALSSGQIRALGLNLRALGFPINRGLNVCRLGSFGLGLFIFASKAAITLAALSASRFVHLVSTLRALSLPIDGRCGLRPRPPRLWFSRQPLGQPLRLWRPLRRPISRPFHAPPSERGEITVMGLSMATL